MYGLRTGSTLYVLTDASSLHSGTDEEWADDSNAMTAADAQAFKRACSCLDLAARRRRSQLFTPLPVLVCRFSDC